MSDFVDTKIAKLFAILLSWEIFATDSVSEYGEFPGLDDGCYGRIYQRETCYNSISPRGQDLWVIHDDLVDRKDEYCALKIHACRVTAGESLKLLVAKFEVHPDNYSVDRSLDVFLSCIVVDPLLFNGETIYAWVNKADKYLLGVLKKEYSFKKSTVKLSDSEGNRLHLPQKTVQLKVKINKLKVNKNLFLDYILNADR